MGRVALPPGKRTRLVRLFEQSVCTPPFPASSNHPSVSWVVVIFPDGTVHVYKSSYSASPERHKSYFLRYQIALRAPPPSPLHTNRPRQTGNRRRGSRLGQFRSNILDSWALHIIPLNLSGSRLLAAEGCEGCGRWSRPLAQRFQLPAAFWRVWGKATLPSRGRVAPAVLDLDRNGEAPPVRGSGMGCVAPPAWRRGEADARTKEPAVAPGMAQAGVKWHAKLDTRSGSSGS